MKTIYTILQCFQPHTGVVYCDANYVMKMKLSATIGVTLKDRSVVLDQWYDVGCWGDGWDK
jgi:hypothetical protein